MGNCCESRHKYGLSEAKLKADIETSANRISTKCMKIYDKDNSGYLEVNE